jgi:hypothetical protein
MRRVSMRGGKERGPLRALSSKLRSGAERARDYMCDVVSVPPMVVSGAVSVVVVVVVVVVCSGVVVLVSSFLAQPDVVNVRATRASDESAISFRILCVHLL